MSSPNEGPVRAWVIMPASSADETLSSPIDSTGLNYHTFYVTGAGTVSSGILTFEEAPSVDYTGTWASISTTDFSSVAVGSGATAAVHLTVANYGAIRCRISTIVGGGGTIVVRYTGN